jgi:hypothetical protein
MKTSNYILTAFYTFLFGGVLVMAVASKFHQENNNNNNETEYRADEKKLEPFSVLVTEQGAHFQLGTAEYPHILTFYKLPNSCEFPPFTIKNDTLFISANTKRDYNGTMDVIYCKDVTSIVAKEKSYLKLQDFKINRNDTMLIKLNDSKIDVFSQNTKDNNMALFIQAQESEINLNQAHFKTLNVKIDRSKLNAWNTTIGNLSLNLKNYSFMGAPATMEKVNLEVDSTSHFNLYSIN